MKESKNIKENTHISNLQIKLFHDNLIHKTQNQNEDQINKIKLSKQESNQTFNSKTKDKTKLIQSSKILQEISKTNSSLLNEKPLIPPIPIKTDNKKFTFESVGKVTKLSCNNLIGLTSKREKDIKTLFLSSK